MGGGDYVAFTAPKAEPIDGRESVADLTIRFIEYDVKSTDPDVQRQHYAGHARRIVDAFREHIPGGLWDALIAEMVSAHASVLRIPRGGPDGAVTRTWEAHARGQGVRINVEFLGVDGDG